MCFISSGGDSTGVSFCIFSTFLSLSKQCSCILSAGFLAFYSFSSRFKNYELEIDIFLAFISLSSLFFACISLFSPIKFYLSFKSIYSCISKFFCVFSYPINSSTKFVFEWTFDY